MSNYREIQDIADNHLCPEHPEAALVVVWDQDHYRLACGEAHWVDKLQRLMSPSELYRLGVPQDPQIENTLKRRYHMTTPNEQAAAKEALKQHKEAVEIALQHKEAKQAAVTQKQEPVEHHPMTLSDWYTRLRQFYPRAVIQTYPLGYEQRALAMLPADLHAWVAEVFEHPQGAMIAQGHGYASEQEEKGEPPPVLTPRWVWQRAEERAEIAAISRLVPIGLEPLEDALSKAVPLGI